MIKPSKCKKLSMVWRTLLGVINPCDNCDRADYYKVMLNFYYNK